MRPCAVFDLDKTLINAISLLEFYPVYLGRLDPQSAERKTEKFKSSIAEKFQEESSRAKLNQWYYFEYLNQASITTLRESAQDWFETKLKEPRFFIDEVVDKLNFHKDLGHHTVVLTGSFREIVIPICDYLGVESYICAPLTESEGKYTGELYNRPTIGVGKQEALQKFCHDQNINPTISFGYGDDSSDVPFLEILGFPHLICHSTGDSYEIALQRGWKVLVV